MKEWFVAATALALGAVAGTATAVQAADVPPPWAYGFTAPVPPGTSQAEPNPQQVLDDVTLHTLPGSRFSFTRAQIANRYGPADWFPEDHPAMPEISHRSMPAACATIQTAKVGRRTPTSPALPTNTSSSR